jgi:hypothetical protein
MVSARWTARHWKGRRKLKVRRGSSPVVSQFGTAGGEARPRNAEGNSSETTDNTKSSGHDLLRSVLPSDFGQTELARTLKHLEFQHAARSVFDNSLCRRLQATVDSGGIQTELFSLLSSFE